MQLRARITIADHRAAYRWSARHGALACAFAKQRARVLCIYAVVPLAVMVIAFVQHTVVWFVLAGLAAAWAAWAASRSLSPVAREELYTRQVDRMVELGAIRIPDQSTLITLEPAGVRSVDDDATEMFLPFARFKDAVRVNDTILLVDEDAPVMMIPLAAFESEAQCADFLTRFRRAVAGGSAAPSVTPA